MMTREQAIAVHESRVWQRMPIERAALIQLQEKLLFMPFDEFHRGVEALLGRSVWTHEFAKPALLLAEYRGDKEAPSIQEIIDMIPAEKLIAVVVEHGASRPESTQ